MSVEGVGTPRGMHEDLIGRPVLDPTGRAYGLLDELFVSRDTGRPEYGIVRLDEAGTDRVAVPLDRARATERGIDLPLDLDRVLAAPRVRGTVDEIPPEAGRRIHEHFASAPQPQRTEAPTTELPPTSERPASEDAAEVTLSEEQLAVETRTEAVERVRVRKRVVTEEVTLTVAVRREELVIEREPVTDADGLPALATGDGSPFGPAADLVVVLHAEEPVVTKRVVPVETVRLRREAVTEERHIAETVAREHVEVDEQELPTTPIPEDPRT